MTALALETKAVLQHIDDVREELESGVRFHSGEVEFLTSSWDVAVVEVGAGDVAVALAVDRAITRFRPEVVLFIGTATGLGDDVALGDVMYAGWVQSLRSVKFSRGGDFQPSPHEVLSTKRISRCASCVCNSDPWREDEDEWPMRRQSAYEGWIVSVDDLVARADEIREFGPAGLAVAQLAVETVAHDMLSAMHVHPHVEALVVRGIGALADGAASDDQWYTAASAASCFAFHVLASFGVHEAVRTAPANESARLTPGTYLTRVEIVNLRYIQKCEWEIDASSGPGWHVILGGNGHGKTTFLRCIALALFDAREAEALRQDWRAWVYRRCNEGGRASVTLTGPGGAGEPRTFALPRVVSTLTPGWSPAPAMRQAGAGRDTTAPIFSAGYGPSRRFLGGDREYEEELVAYPALVRHATLFSERAALSESLTWLKKLRGKQIEGDSDHDFLDAICDFISYSDLLSFGLKIGFSPSEEVHFYDGSGSGFPIEELSDGSRAILSLVLDLLRHLAAIHGADAMFSPVDPARVCLPGLVLIDDIELHLHPKWQHRIGHRFRSCFPLVQFIVTTHSPLVCQAADSAYLLPCNDTLRPCGRHLVGAELDRIRHGDVLGAYSTERGRRG